MNRKFVLALALIVCIGGCCYRRGMNSSVEASRNDFRIFAKDTNSIYFKFDSALIQDEGIERINHLISELKKVRNVKLLIYGYADRAGRKPYNYKLSMRRINSVKKLLINSGVIKANNISIETKTVGEKDPLISYNTIDNNPTSRRVDVFIINNSPYAVVAKASHK
jgi:outer membrane protein OmpA-like peptidoglycan-associated protein